jgi:hypothetical protein
LSGRIGLQHTSVAPRNDDNFTIGAESDGLRAKAGVDDAVGIRKRDRVRRFLPRGQQAGQRAAFKRCRVARGHLIEHRAKALPFDKARGVKELALLVQSQLVHGEDAGVLELAGDLRLADETQDMLRPRLAFRAQYLDRHIAPQRGVVCGEDGARTARHDRFTEIVALLA